MRSYHKIGARMSITINFLNSHSDYFPISFGDYSEEKGERFHQDLATIEERYQGYYNVNMLAVYCWCLNRDIPIIDDVEINHIRRKLKRSFLNRFVLFCIVLLLNKPNYVLPETIFFILFINKYMNLYL